MFKATEILREEQKLNGYSVLLNMQQLNKHLNKLKA